MTLNRKVGEGRDAIQAGDPVRVVAFVPTAYGRTDNHGMRPGLYHNPRWLRVEGAAGQRHDVHELSLDHAPGHAPGVVEASSLRIGDLPETPFWETDRMTGASHELLRLIGIDYLALVDQPSASGTVRAYRCEWQDGTIMAYAASDLTLAERGPVWRREHGLPNAFPDIAAESAFHALIGETDDVRNPATGLYAFSADDAEQALLDGTAHGVRGGSGSPLPDGERTASLVLYRDAELGERVRLDTLGQLGVAPAPAP